jgi:phosphinothricin acetyltransferase
VYVAGTCRGRGIGKRLLAPLIDAARERGLHSMVAGIDAGNEASIRLHEQFGFKEVGHFKEVGWKFNRWLDLKFMQLIL